MRSGHRALLAAGLALLILLTANVERQWRAIQASTAGWSASTATPRTAWWRPPAGRVAWQWELDHPLNLGSATDMGTAARTFGGKKAPHPVVYDIDGFDNPASTVSALHRLGYHAICYLEVGAAESYRPDYGKFPKTALGKAVPGWPGERYLNINDPRVAAIIKARIAMCAKKGFDAIEPDIDDSFTDATGFPITRASNISYDSGLAAYAHSLGLAFGLKNGDAAGFAASMLPRVDFALDEQCFQYGTCGAFYPAFVKAGKAVFEVEYYDQGGPAPARFCPRANADGFDAVELGTALDGEFRVTCF